jgi:hypothetical protein
MRSRDAESSYPTKSLSLRSEDSASRLREDYSSGRKSGSTHPSRASLDMRRDFVQ